MINTGDGCSKLAKGLPIVQGSMWFATCLPLSVCWHIWATRTPNCNWGSSLLVKLLKSKQTAYPCPFENKTEMHPPFHRYSQIYRHQDCIICFPNQNFTSGKEKKSNSTNVYLEHHIYSTAASTFVCLYYLVPKMNQAWTEKYEKSKNHSRNKKLSN